MSLPALHHVGIDCGEAVDDAVDIHIEDFPPMVRRKSRGFSQERDSRIIKEVVQALVLAENFRKDPFPVFQRGDIERPGVESLLSQVCHHFCIEITGVDDGTSQGFVM